MSEPHLYSERFSAMGNVVSAGVWNQLGRPGLDRLALLLRESVQNSWDARESNSIDYAIESFTLDAARRAEYGRFFASSPPEAAYRSGSELAERITSLGEWLGHGAARLLIVSDRGTRGLDGPTRADETTLGDEERNFVDFLRNVGQPPTKGHGGGTFGYGKAAFYLASECRTIVVHTRCRHRGQLEERITAAALTHHYEVEKGRFTGRHWWGLGNEDAGSPITGAPAKDWAKRLGLPDFSESQKGTSIAVVGPVFNDEELSELPWLCLRHLWPKLEAVDRGRPPISIRLRVAGHALPVPAPSLTPPYDGFWNALKDIRAGNAKTVSYYQEPVGSLAIRHAFLSNSEEQKTTRLEHEVRPKHVALLRTPELVVKYIEGGRSLASDQVGFTGVFLASDNADRAFAQSEPPTHDDWQPASVSDKRFRGIVTQSLKKIRQHVRDFAMPHEASMDAAGGRSLASLANDFAELLPGLGGSAPDASRPGRTDDPSPRKKKTRPEAKLLDANDFVERDGRSCFAFHVDVTHGQGSESTRLTADIYSVVSGGSRETEAPVGASKLRDGWWESPRGVRGNGVSVVVGPRQQGRWTLIVPVEDSSASAVEVAATSIDEATA